jgi:hypothetical protein
MYKVNINSNNIHISKTEKMDKIKGTRNRAGRTMMGHNRTRELQY